MKVTTISSPKGNVWPLVPFEKAAVAQSDRGKRLKQRDYLAEGLVPVIDQGQSLVGGYTNDEDSAFVGDLPVVLFGDHTRAVKLVQHRFAVGADGIKIFRPAEGVRVKFLYYWMRSARLPDRGYGRHYQYLRLSTRSHQNPISLRPMCWEFVFFNTALPFGVATKSKMPIAFIQNEVKEILRRYRVLDPFRRPRKSWRDQLKRCYIKHFGSSGSDRNNISLCVLSRPLCSSNVSACQLFRVPLFSFEYKNKSLPISEDRQGLLLTGDLTMNLGVFEEMKLHFRTWRWMQIDVMQVPHHGSRHSWKIGLVAHCVHRHSVLCVPDHSKSKAHPHDQVVAALMGLAPIRANYQQSVVQTFHFDAP